MSLGITPAVCAPQDLLVVYPWALSNVIAGAPLLFPPYVVGARYAAEYRNYYWQHVKSGEHGLKLSGVHEFYPVKGDRISDQPEADSGGNFGRIARTNMMDDFKKALFSEELSGIPIEAWIGFLSIFSQSTTREAVMAKLDSRTKTYTKGQAVLSDQAVTRIRDAIAEIASLLQDVSGR